MFFNSVKTLLMATVAVFNCSTVEKEFLPTNSFRAESLELQRQDASSILIRNSATVSSTYAWSLGTYAALFSIG